MKTSTRPINGPLIFFWYRATVEAAAGCTPWPDGCETRRGRGSWAATIMKRRAKL